MSSSSSRSDQGRPSLRRRATRIDVLAADGQIAEIGPIGKVPPVRRSSRRRARCCCPAWWTCTPICASLAVSTPRTSKPVRPQPLLGGYTAVFAMANTDPVADSPVVTDHVWRRGQQVGLVDVHPVGAVTVGLGGQAAHRDGPDGRQCRSGADVLRRRRCVHDPLVMRRALEYATGLVC